MFAIDTNIQEPVFLVPTLDLAVIVVADDQNLVSG